MRQGPATSSQEGKETNAINTGAMGKVRKSSVRKEKEKSASAGNQEANDKGWANGGKKECGMAEVNYSRRGQERKECKLPELIRSKGICTCKKREGEGVDMEERTTMWR